MESLNVYLDLALCYGRKDKEFASHEVELQRN